MASTESPAPVMPDLDERVRRLRAQRQQGAVGTVAAAPVQPGNSKTPPVTSSFTAGGEARIVLAVDYGTTYTGVAYAKTTGSDDLDLENIYVVTTWDGEEQDKVPSQFSYSETPNFKKQYGYDIDDGSDVLARTKLEFEDGDDRLRELKAFTDTLYGLSKIELTDEAAISSEIPEHLSKNAEDIVEDYLREVAEVVRVHITTTFGKRVPDQIPIDMIITHPAVSAGTASKPR